MNPTNVKRDRGTIEVTADDKQHILRGECPRCNKYLAGVTPRVTTSWLMVTFHCSDESCGYNGYYEYELPEPKFVVYEKGHRE